MSLIHQTAPIFIIRHGETHWNKSHRFQGQKDSPLTLNGINQIRAVSHTLRKHVQKFDHFQIFASPLGRTRQSAAILCEEVGLEFNEVEFVDQLKERHYGHWQGRLRKDVENFYSDEFVSSQNDPWEYRIAGGGESLHDVAQRLISWLSEQSFLRPTIIMTHSGTGRVLRRQYLQASLSEFLAYDEPQTSMFKLEEQSVDEFRPTPLTLKEIGCNDLDVDLRTLAG